MPASCSRSPSRPSRGSPSAPRALILAAYALAWQLKLPRIRRPFRVIATFNGLFVGYTALSLALAWLREHLGTISILGTALTLAATTGVALTAMWLLPERADDRPRGSSPARCSSPSGRS